jgi:hypothetical protein
MRQMRAGDNGLHYLDNIVCQHKARGGAHQNASGPERRFARFNPG